MAPVVKNPPADTGDERHMGSAPGSEDPMEEDMAAHCSILAWRIPMDREAWWAIVHGTAKN